MKAKISLLLLAFSAMPAFSQQQVETQPPASELAPPSQAAAVKLPSALQWVQRLSSSLKELNFDTSFVVVRNNRAEPYRWLHGVEENNELELLTLLNGPRKESIRIDNNVSYFESDNPPYTVNSSAISGPIPRAFSGNVEKLQQSYDFITVGKSRILGRPAQLIRLECKDKQRFGYWLWLDIQSGLLLKAAVISRNGELLEQIQFTHLLITEHSNDLLKQLITVELPSPAASIAKPIALPWQVNWLPSGFELVNSNRGLLSTINEQVESLMYNDGLVDVSIYVSRSDEAARQASINQTGATVLLSQLREGYEINVVGKIPANTALQIAESVSFN